MKALESKTISACLVLALLCCPLGGIAKDCEEEYAKLAPQERPGSPAAKFAEFRRESETPLDHFFPNGNRHTLKDGSILFVPKISEEESGRFAGAVNDLLDKQVKLGLRPAKTVNEFRAWLEEHPFPMPTEIHSGETLDGFANKAVLEFIASKYGNDKQSFLAALHGNLPELAWRAASAALEGGKNVVLGLGNWVWFSIGVSTVGGVATSFLSSPLDPVNDWANKKSAKYLGWLQKGIQNILTGNGSADSDDDDETTARKKEIQETLKNAQQARPELEKELKELEEKRNSGQTLTNEEEVRLWKQFGARFYMLNFKLSKTLQDNVNSGRGSFEGRALTTPLMYASNIGVAELQFDMHDRHVKELNAKIAALPKGADPKDLNAELAEHKRGRDFAKKTIAANLAAWQIERFIYPETSDGAPEKAGNEGFSDVFDRVTKNIGFEALAVQYDDAMRKALQQYDEKMKNLSKLASGKYKPVTNLSD